MGGFSIVAIGYEIADALELPTPAQHRRGPAPQTLAICRSTPMSLARLEDSSGLTRMFLCCYVDTRIRVYDVKELVAVIVPPQVTRKYWALMTI